MENSTLVIWMKFKNAKIFKDAMVKWNVRRWYDIKWIRNENKKILLSIEKNVVIREYMLHLFKGRQHCRLRHFIQNVIMPINLRTS